MNRHIVKRTFRRHSNIHRWKTMNRNRKFLLSYSIEDSLKISTMLLDPWFFTSVRKYKTNRLTQEEGHIWEEKSKENEIPFFFFFCSPHLLIPVKATWTMTSHSISYFFTCRKIRHNLLKYAKRYKSGLLESAWKPRASENQDGIFFPGCRKRILCNWN